jgi:hypothetical protein
MPATYLCIVLGSLADFSRWSRQIAHFGSLSAKKTHPGTTARPLPSDFRMPVSRSFHRRAGLEEVNSDTLSNRVPIHMKRLSSLFLLLVLAGSACAGVPLHFGENECSMGGMMDMDCCKAALGQTETTKLTGAELLCAISCAQNGTTSPPNAIRVTPPSPARTPSNAVTTRSLPDVSIRFRAGDRLHGSPGFAAPAYLLNLAFLI